MLTTTNYGLKKPEGTDVVDVQNFNDNADIIDTKLKELYNSVSDLTYQTAGGTATAITLSLPTLINGYSKTFIASANNSGAATTINGKPLYKPGTTTAPNLIAGKAYTVWYDSGKSCFFIKASAEGDAVAANVLAGKKFSNDNDTGLVGTLDLSNLVSGNIRSGVTINGVGGKSSVVDTADANAATGQILNGQTAYVNGSKITGTMTDRTKTGDDYFNSSYPAMRINKGQNIQYGTYGTVSPAPRLAICPPQGYYPGNGSSYVTMEASEVANTIGLTSDKLISGTTVCGVSGNIPNRGTYQYTGGIGNAYDSNTGSNYLAFNNIPWGYYQSNNDGWSPEIRAKFSDVANAIGLTSDKLVSGQNILGVNGSATIESLGGKLITTGSIAGTGASSYSVNVGFNIQFVVGKYGSRIFTVNNGYSSIPSDVAMDSSFSGNLTNYMSISGTNLNWSGTSISSGNYAYFIAIGY